jgi:uncharacterized protein (TIRG00374 family)
VLPSRGGDLLRAALVARRRAVSVSGVLAVVVIERVADVLMLVAIALTLSRVMTFPAVVAVAMMTLTAGMVGAVTLLLLVAGKSGGAAKLAQRLRMPRPVVQMIESFGDGLRAAGGPRQLVVACALSAVAWSLWAAAALCNVIACGLIVPWYAALFVMLVVNLGGLVPAAPGAIGVYHFLAVLALSVWVSDTAVSFGFAVVSHALGLAVVSTLGVFGLMRQGLSTRAIQTASIAPGVQP